MYCDSWSHYSTNIGMCFFLDDYSSFQYKKQSDQSKLIWFKTIFIVMDFDSLIHQSLRDFLIGHFVRRAWIFLHKFAVTGAEPVFAPIYLRGRWSDRDNIYIEQN